MIFSHVFHFQRRPGIPWSLLFSLKISVEMRNPLHWEIDVELTVINESRERELKLLMHWLKGFYGN